MSEQEQNQFAIIPRGNGVYDVFCGKGWDKWNCFAREGRRLLFLKGNYSMTNTEYKELAKLI